MKTKFNIILITGNQLNLESGVFNKKKDFLDLKGNEFSNKLKKMKIESSFKFVNFSHIKIKDFIKEMRNLKELEVFHFDQSFYNFFEKLNIYPIKLEGNIEEKKCLKCKRIFSDIKSKNYICVKCKEETLVENIISLNMSVKNYKTLIEKINFKQMNNLFFQIQDGKDISKKENNPIWNVNLRNKEINFIITIGFDEDSIELNKFFLDLKSLKNENNFFYNYSLYNFENSEIFDINIIEKNFFSKIEYFLNKVKTEILTKVETKK